MNKLDTFARHGYASYNIGIIRPPWALRTKCIVCGDMIIHNQYQKILKFNRIAHLRCSRGYWKK